MTDYPHAVTIDHNKIGEVSDWLIIELTKLGVTRWNTNFQGNPIYAAYHFDAESIWDRAVFKEQWRYSFRDPQLAMLFKLTFGSKKLANDI